MTSSQWDTHGCSQIKHFQVQTVARALLRRWGDKKTLPMPFKSFQCSPILGELLTGAERDLLFVFGRFTSGPPSGFEFVTGVSFIYFSHFPSTFNLIHSMISSNLLLSGQSVEKLSMLQEIFQHDVRNLKNIHLLNREVDP